MVHYPLVGLQEKWTDHGNTVVLVYGFMKLFFCT